MDAMTARRLSALTTDFYARTSTSFSATRQASWPGWARLLALLPESAAPLQVYDLACGNLRFERYLAGSGRHVHAWSVDGADELLSLGMTSLGALDCAPVVHVHQADIMSALFAGKVEELLADVPPCDLAVSFGFLHHVPMACLREQVLRLLVESVRPGGTVAVSFWQFERSARIMAKAEPVAGGDAGDYLLGWQERSDVKRYCHSFSEREIDALADSVRATAYEIARFSSDGKTSDLNRYLVLQYREQPSGTVA